MRTIVESAVKVFLAKSRASEPALIEALIDAGIEKSIAVRLLDFVPSAFTRVLLDGKGVEFSENYLRMNAGGKLSKEMRFAEEPVYVAALDVARAGVGEDEMTAIVSRSAEFDCINNALDGGARLEDLVMSPTILLDANFNETAAPPSKAWWQFWK